MCVNVKTFADDKKGEEDKKAKKETKYDKLFKDKKKETASSKFITVHKCDGKLYLEVPVKYLQEICVNSCALTSSKCTAQDRRLLRTAGMSSLVVR